MFVLPQFQVILSEIVIFKSEQISGDFVNSFFKIRNDSNVKINLRKSSRLGTEYLDQL